MQEVEIEEEIRNKVAIPKIKIRSERMMREGRRNSQDDYGYPDIIGLYSTAQRFIKKKMIVASFCVYDNLKVMEQMWGAFHL